MMLMDLLDVQTDTTGVAIRIHAIIISLKVQGGIFTVKLGQGTWIGLE